jgi:hypothetical protein
MKKIIRLTENDLSRIVKRVINEQYDEDDDMYDTHNDETEEITRSIMRLLKPYFKKHGSDNTASLLSDIMLYVEDGLLEIPDLYEN